MNRTDEAKTALTLWNLLQELEDLLWKIYQPDFLDFLSSSDTHQPGLY